MTRSRAWYAALVVFVVAAGLVLRSGSLGIRESIMKYGGDGLWALVIFLAIGLVIPRATTSRVAFAGLLVCWCVEFSQLYHGEWLDRLRSTIFGRLVLGSTFNSPDLLAYAAGIVLGAFAEWACRSLLKKTGD